MERGVGMSNVIYSIECPKCHKPLVIYFSRNDMKIFAQCPTSHCEYHFREYPILSDELKLLYLEEYYKTNNHLEVQNV